jgi:hypothetical protein
MIATTMIVPPAATSYQYDIWGAEIPTLPQL